MSGDVLKLTTNSGRMWVFMWEGQTTNQLGERRLSTPESNSSEVGWNWFDPAGISSAFPTITRQRRRWRSPSSSNVEEIELKEKKDQEIEQPSQPNKKSSLCTLRRRRLQEKGRRRSRRGRQRTAARTGRNHRWESAGGRPWNLRTKRTWCCLRRGSERRRRSTAGKFGLVPWRQRKSGSSGGRLWRRPSSRDPPCRRGTAAPRTCAPCRCHRVAGHGRRRRRRSAAAGTSRWRRSPRRKQTRTGRTSRTRTRKRSPPPPTLLLGEQDWMEAMHDHPSCFLTKKKKNPIEKHVVVVLLILPFYIQNRHVMYSRQIENR